MSVDRFRFVSPGIFINEIDESQVPRQRVVGTGPAIIGLASRGPAFRPVQVSSFDEFVGIFGPPSPGQGVGTGDDWRDGIQATPTYGAYAAQAYLANNAPATFIRILGAESSRATADGKAGWEMPNTSTSQGGVYGLFICNSGAVNTNLTGTMAAVWYVTSSYSIALSGAMGCPPSVSAQNAVTASLNTLIKTVGANKEFKVYIGDGTTQIKNTTFNFNPTSPRYIRKVFNASPILLNSDVTSTTALQYYFLGESFDKTVNDLFNYGSEDLYGMIVGLGSGSNAAAGDFRMSYKKPETPPIISQNMEPDDNANFNINGSGSMKDLFSVAARDEAEWLQNNVKISITDIADSPNPDFTLYGTFSLMVRAIDDSDEVPLILEQWNNLSLDPKSNNYIGKRIGDKYVEFDATNKRFREYGQYENQSRFIRVKMNPDVDSGNGIDPVLLPWGFRGIPKYKGFQIVSGSETVGQIGSGSGRAAGPDAGGPPEAALTSPFMTLETDNTFSPPPGTLTAGPIGAQVGRRGGMPSNCSASISWPMLPLRLSSSDGQMVDDTNAFFGLTTARNTTSTVFDPSVKEFLKTRPRTQQDGWQVLQINGTGTKDAWLERGPGFSLDNLCMHSNTTTAYYSGSTNLYKESSPGGAYRAGTSMSVVSSSYKEVLAQGFDRFTVPLVGGFDGLNVKVKDPLSNTAMGGQSAPVSDGADNAMYYSLITAVDSLADPEFVDMNLAAVPGVWQRNVTNRLLRVCQDRADALAIIDIEGDYTAAAENTNTFNNRVGTVSNAVQYIKNRALNNSYGAAYYPWVQIQDSLAGSRVWVPPSVAILGTYASSEASADVWFAPAGFNRGGLSDGAAGLPVVGVVEKLTSKQRDALYEVGINPIASFPAEGIVVFGQKTLQATASALDRINVRRLLIFLKRRISRIAATILFDPNVQITWNRFLNQVEPLLRSVKSRFGLSEYRVILDNTTTTPEMVDRNIMYAKVLLQPTRAIEFIALDFVITRTGAAFND